MASLDGDSSLSENVSFLKDLAKKYEIALDGVPAKRSLNLLTSASDFPGHRRALSPGRPNAPRSMSPQRAPVKRPPWCPARNTKTNALDPQHLTQARRPASPGRRPLMGPRGEENVRDERAEKRAANCIITGEGLRTADLRTEANFTIHVRDENGEPVTTGGDRIRVVFRGRSAPELQLLDMGDGTYEGRYMANVSGTYELLAMLDGKVRCGWVVHRCICSVQQGGSRICAVGVCTSGRREKSCTIQHQI